MATRAVEDYLKAIYRLQQIGTQATTNAIAARLGVRAASVTSMLRYLSEHGLADYTRYKGVSLTDAGMTEALRVIRRHRLIELYLHEVLEIPWDRVHEQAELLEHAVSPYIEERMDAKLSYPRFDPHGSPIPSSTGTLPEQDLIQLSDLSEKSRAVIQYVPDESPELLRYAASLGLVLGSVVMIMKREPFDGPMSITVTTPDGQEVEQVISTQLAREISVTSPPE